MASAPARSVVWGFSMAREPVTLSMGGGDAPAHVAATLSEIPSGSKDPSGNPYPRSPRPKNVFGGGGDAPDIGTNVCTPF